MAQSRLTPALLVLGLLAGCGERSRPPEPAAAPAPKAAPAVVTPPAPAPPPRLDRAALIAAAAAASDALAAGRPYDSSDLADRRFELRLPFGCPGRDDAETDLQVRVDDKTHTLRLSARVEDWTQAPWAGALAGGPEVEAIEGFWLRRPWLLSDTCPAPKAAADADVSPETLALAQVFAAGGSRVGRRGGRPYTVTRKLDDASPAPPSGGYRVVLEGRLAGRDERGGPLRCWTAHPDQRPTCLVLATFDRVAFETADGEVLGEWPS